MAGRGRRKRDPDMGKTSTALPETRDYDIINHLARSQMARLTFGIAPTALTAAFNDWAAHLATAPGKQLDLAHRAWSDALSLGLYGAGAAVGATPEPVVDAKPHDRRFADDAWQKWPFNLWSQAFLAQERWWSAAMTDVPGVTGAHERVADFVTRQVLDTLSPGNFLPTNPEVLSATLSEGGQNLVRGAMNFWLDLARSPADHRPEPGSGFDVGRDLAVTPGKVVFRNRLIELIHYAPDTPTQHPEPILIVPAWIMKFYILDLSPRNSLVRFLVSQGFSVFMISWLNPGAEDRDLSMDDYQTLGVMAALDAIQAITRRSRVHAIGYCLGGTLLAITAATMGRDGDDRLASVTLLAAQTDFTEAGELTLFINEAQVTYLEDMMWRQGYLSTEQMGGTFRLLRSADLIWSKNVRSYLLGKPLPMTDLLAWNADGTRLPATMHSQYLRRLFLKNELAEGRYHVGPRPVTVSNIRAPILAVGTEYDHVAPWTSVYKIHLLADVPVTFILASGGHNTGIVAEPGQPDRHFRMDTTGSNMLFREDHDWLAETPPQEGSWWPALVDWLRSRSSAPERPPVDFRDEPHLCDAPGTYVLRH